MKRFNHGLIVGLAVLLLAAVSFIGCESPTEAEVVTGPAGPAGTAGTPGTGTPGNSGSIYLSGALTTEAVQIALNSAAPVVFDGVDVDNLLVIPEGKTVTLVGNPAIRPATGGGLVLVVAGTVNGQGYIAGGNTGTTQVIHKAAFDTKYLAAGTTHLVALAPSGGLIPADAIIDNDAAILGPITVKAAGTAAGEVAVAGLTSKTVYVIGNAQLDTAVTATALNVSGNVTTGVPFTASTTPLNVGGNLNITAATTNAGTGAIAVGRNLTATGALSLAVGASGLTVNGTTSIPGGFALTGSTPKATFNGTTNIGGTINLGALSTIAGTGAVTLATAPAATAATTISITNTKGVTISVDVANPGYSIKVATGGRLVVPATKKITFGSTAALQLDPGTYQGIAGGATFTAATGVIVTGSTAGDGVRVYNGSSAANYIALTATTANAATYTPTASTGTGAGPVVLSSAGINIPAGSGGGGLLSYGTLGGTYTGTLTVRGTSDIRLGVNTTFANAGGLALVDGSTLDVGAGFVFGTTAGAGIRYAVAETSNGGVAEDQIAIKASGTNFTAIADDGAGGEGPAILGKVNIAEGNYITATPGTTTTAGTSAAGTITAKYSGVSDDTTLTFKGPAS
ncbi:hypothetical protein AGMMS49942_29310 [Spirochaetia bacterium]|nr:hypothetical protein AGMMS49942_29310 [Spirochaetia bacterium]